MGRRGNGEGTYTTLENGKIMYKKSLGRGRDGKRKYITVTGDTKIECSRKMSKKMAELEAVKNLPKEVSTGTLESLCMRHLKDDCSRKHKLKPKSADRREGTIKNQIGAYAIGQMQVQCITSQDIDDHIEDLISNSGLSVSSIKKTIDVINAAYKWGIRSGLVKENPCTAKMEDMRKRLENLEVIEADDADVVVLSREEEEKLVAVKEIKNKLDGRVKFKFIYYVLILLYTGMRVGELCALRWRDYHPHLGTLTINKTRYIAKNRNDKTQEGYLPEEGRVKNAKSREIVLTENAKEVFDELYLLRGKPDGSEYICINRSKKPSNPSNVERCFSTIYKEAGLEDYVTGAHVLRRTCATRFYEAGSTEKEIALYLGDTEATVSRYYISVKKRIIEGGRTKNVVPIPQAGRRQDKET